MENNIENDALKQHLVSIVGIYTTHANQKKDDDLNACATKLTEFLPENKQLSPHVQEIVNKLSKEDENINQSDYNMLLRALKHYFFHEIDMQLQNSVSYKKASFLDEQLQEYTNDTKQIELICKEYTDYCGKFSAHQETIKEMLKETFDVDKASIEMTINNASGANASFIVKILSNEYYIKTCMDRYDSHKINPKELFLYKVMEYTGFGPETNFLIKKYSTSHGSTAHGAYIMTKKVPNLLLTDGTFKLQNYGASKEVEFSIDLSAASLLHDLLSLTDVFGRMGNYGFTSIDEGTAKVYEDDEEQKTEAKQSSWIQFIDHLPGNNGHFSCIKKDKEQLNDYSPRSQLLVSDANMGDESVFGDMLWSHSSWEKFTLARNTYDKLFKERKFEDAIGRAKNDIEDLIRKYGANFVEDADGVLDFYCDKIEKNIEIYKNTHYYTEAQVTP